MSVHDGVREAKVLLVASIEASGNVREACRRLGIHHSSYYRWKRQIAEPGPATPTRRRSLRDRHLETEIIQFALANPAFGPQRVADELAIQRYVVVSPSKVWRTLRRHRLNTSRLRYQLLQLHRDGPPPQPRPPHRPWVGTLDADLPGDLVQMDCFHVGTFKETRLGAAKHTKGVIWQYTAIDVASSWTWAELHVTPHNPSPVLTSALAHRVAADLTAWGWTPKAISTDNGNEFIATDFTTTLTDLGITHRRIKAGRPQSNGKVERVQGTILQECYQPALLIAVEPSITALRRDLDDYLAYYNHRRPHRGKWNQGRPPTDIIHPATKLTPKP